MARVLGYGGLGNTNGARDFSNKAVAVDQSQTTAPQFVQMHVIAYLSALGGAIAELFK